MPVSEKERRRVTRIGSYARRMSGISALFMCPLKSKSCKTRFNQLPNFDSIRLANQNRRARDPFAMRIFYLAKENSAETAGDPGLVSLCWNLAASSIDISNLHVESAPVEVTRSVTRRCAPNNPETD